MKILVFGNIYPSPWERTRGTFSRETAVGLSHFDEVRVVAPWAAWTHVRRPNALFRVPHSSFTGLNAEYPTYWSVPRMHGLHGRREAKSVTRMLQRLRKDFPFDGILANFAYPDGVAAVHLAKQFGVPCIIALLGSDINNMPKDPRLKKQIVWAMQEADYSVAVSAALRDAAVALGGPSERILVQYNGVDGERFVQLDRTTARAAVGITHDDPLVLYVGRLSPEKGVQHLPEAAAILRELGHSSVRWSIVGYGPLKDTIEKEITARGLQSVITMHGGQSHELMPNWISASDVLVLPSYMEGCPNVVLESLAVGRPVVASAVGGIPELLSKNNGQLTVPGSAASIAEGLSSVLAQTWNGDYLRSTVPNLSWTEVGRTYHNLFENAISTRSAVPGVKPREEETRSMS